MRPAFPAQRWNRPLIAAGVTTLIAAVPMGLVIVGDFAATVIWFAPLAAACAAGIVAVGKRPESLAARRLLAFGVLGMAWLLAGDALLLGYDAAGERWWLGPASVAVQVLGLLMPVGFVALLAVYPDGEYHRRYERTVVRGCGALAAVVPLVLLVARPTLAPAWFFEWTQEVPSGFEPFPEVESPFHVDALSVLAAPAAAYHEAALGLLPLVAAAVVVLRHRHLSPDQRLQVRWLLLGAFGLALMPIEQVAYANGLLSPWVSTAFEILILVALPVLSAVGLVRPDLFDVGLAVRRTLIYVPLWIVIGAAYAGVAAALGLAASGEGLRVAVGVTIVATVLFDPARRALVRRAATWAYGESLSGEELLRRLGATLEHTLDLEALSRGVASAAREGLGAGWTRLSVAGLAPVLAGEPPPAGQPAALRAPLVHGGERLGEIECGPRVRGRAQAHDQERLETLARQAALAIHNARLAAELGLRLGEIREQAAELAASRSRIVTAEDAARRRIGRDIHDGAQQELVALIARLALARNQLGRDPGRLDETFGDLQAEARQALENLRQFASGIHPPVLSDRGLVEAIESRAARLPVGVTIECDPGMRDARFSEAVEGAAYFVVTEGLTNALKHSGAERVRVRLVRSDGALEVEVADDGAGFDPKAAGGSGLAGLADRVAALGGSLAVEASPGTGTRLRARFGVDAPAKVRG